MENQKSGCAIECEIMRRTLTEAQKIGAYLVEENRRLQAQVAALTDLAMSAQNAAQDEDNEKWRKRCESAHAN